MGILLSFRVEIYFIWSVPVSPLRFLVKARKMASTPSTLKKEKKDESFFDKIGGTLARKKKAKEG